MLFIISNSLIYYIIIIFKIILILGIVAFYTIAERKLMAAVQRRKGPNVIGFFGLLQPIADGLKLIIKEVLLPIRAISILFIMTPIMILLLSWIGWNLIPFNLTDIGWFKKLVCPANINILINIPFNTLCSVKRQFFYEKEWLSWNVLSNYSLLLVLFISSINVYSLILAGWSSNSKYAFIGALRSAAQMIAYEVSLGLTLLPLILFSGTFNLFNIVLNQQYTWYIFLLVIPSIIFLISLLAEVNRTPFDLTEAEAELVAGYNVEYSSIVFSMFFLGEYSNMLLMAAFFSIFFLGGFNDTSNFYFNSCSFIIKILCFAILIIIIRATFPRYRYDQLMYLGWKIFLLFSVTTLAYNIFIVNITSCMNYILILV